VGPITTFWLIFLYLLVGMVMREQNEIIQPLYITFYFNMTKILRCREEEGSQDISVL